MNHFIVSVENPTARRLDFRQRPQLGHSPKLNQFAVCLGQFAALDDYFSRPVRIFTLNDH